MASLLLTRPRAQSEEFRAALGRDVPTVISPLIRIEPLDPPLPTAAGIVVTSAHGAAALARLDVPPWLPVFAVGERTAEVARGAGYGAQSATGDADDLVRMILGARPAGPLLHLRGERSRGEIARRLTEAGLRCDEAVVYRQTRQPLSPEARGLLSSASAVVVPLFSPATGSMFATEAPFAARLHLVCISRAVATAVRSVPAASCRIAARPDAATMATETRAALDA